MAQDTAIEIENADGTIPLSQQDIDDGILSKSWTVPPTCHDIVTGVCDNTYQPTAIDEGIVLTQGIIYELDISGDVRLIQNVSENEDDYMEFSKHGNASGIWNKLYPGCFLKISEKVFLLNRTHKQNAAIAIF